MHPYTEKLANYIIKAIDKFQKIPTMVKTILFIFIVFLIILYSKHMGDSELERPQGFLEGFTQSNAFLFKTGPEVYDPFYANIYDYLVFNSAKDDYEIGEIINATSPSMQTKILDIGCGTGHHVAKFEEQKLSAMGIDISESMIDQAKQNYPGYSFKVANALNKNAVMGGVFTHVTCLYFTLYYFQDKALFFQRFDR